MDDRLSTIDDLEHRGQIRRHPDRCGDRVEDQRTLIAIDAGERDYGTFFAVGEEVIDAHAVIERALAVLFRNPLAATAISSCPAWPLPAIERRDHIVELPRLELKRFAGECGP